MKIISAISVCILILIMTSCQYTPSRNVYESDGFESNTTNTNRVYNTDTNSYQTPIVGIFHPHSEDEIGTDEFYNSNENIYEPTSDTEIETLKNGESLVIEIDTMIANNELSRARRTISKAILNQRLSIDEENSLIEKLRSLNASLLTSTDEDGDCKLVTIEKGQTLYAITKENKMTVDAIAALNNIDPNKYNAGQLIKIYKYQFHVISIIGKDYVYLWQNDHIVERYPASVKDLKKGIYRLKGKRKGSLGEMVFSNNVIFAPESKDLTSFSSALKINDDDFKILNMLLVSGALLDIK